MAQGAAASLSESREMGEFQFLLCESCHGEVQSPKLLPCLHNLCTQCLVGSQPSGHCAVCRAPYSPPELPCNVLFANLQAQRGIFQKFSQGGDLACGCGSEREAVFWCPECDWFFCDGVCFTNHQQVKKNSPHEIKPLKDLQAVSSLEFFARARKQSVMYCPKENHKNDAVRFYCNECRQPMCMVCAVLDSKHKSQHCGVQDEVRCRQNKLQSLQRELQKSNHCEAYESLQALVGGMEKVRNETRELIQRQVGEMVKVLKEKEAKFLAEVEDQHQRQVQDVERKLRDVEGLVQRMVSGEQLVEKMRLYASDQAVLEMHPYIRGSLEELRGNQAPVVSFQTQARDFVEVKTQLQALFERVTKAREAVPGRLETAPNQENETKGTESRGSLPSARRAPPQEERATMAQGAAASLSESREMEEEFEFLLCERCRGEAKNPKLLACLHTVCMECLEDNKPVGRCPVCLVSLPCAGGGTSFQDNVLFANLQARLSTYRKIASGRDLVCDHCKDAAEFWCSECCEFLCLKCYKAHQWYLKQKSHETQKVADLKEDSAQSFLEGARKSSNLFCSEHTQAISIYCRGCRKPLCCSCALLDGEHYNAQLYCDIRVEIEGRKEELSRMKAELGEKRRSYEETYSTFHERLQQLEKVRQETRGEIQQKVEEMVRWIQRKGEELLGKVDSQLHQEREDVGKKLQCAERIIKRLESSEQLVEKMNLFASDQEVMDMYPFVKESLEDLRRERVMAVGFRVQAENLSEVRGELQALLERVSGHEDAVGGPPSVAPPVAPVVNSEDLHDEKSQPRSQAPTYTLSLGKTPGGFVPSITSTAKRSMGRREQSIQPSPKVMKLEDHHHLDGGQSSQQHLQDAGLSSWSPPPCQSAPEREQRGADDTVELLENSLHEFRESEVASILISSSEDTEDDMV